MKDVYEKLKNELTGFRDKGLPRFAGAVAKEVERMLEDFCRQDQRFADHVLSSEKTLTDCIAEVLKGVQYSLPDIEAYRRAVRFYLPEAQVEFQFQIKIPAEKATPGKILPGIKPVQDEKKEESEIITMSLLDLL